MGYPETEEEECCPLCYFPAPVHCTAMPCPHAAFAPSHKTGRPWLPDPGWKRIAEKLSGHNPTQGGMAGWCMGLGDVLGVWWCRPTPPLGTLGAKYGSDVMASAKCLSCHPAGHSWWAWRCSVVGTSHLFFASGVTSYQEGKDMTWLNSGSQLGGSGHLGGLWTGFQRWVCYCRCICATLKSCIFQQFRGISFEKKIQAVFTYLKKRLHLVCYGRLHTVHVFTSAMMSLPA